MLTFKKVISNNQNSAHKSRRLCLFNFNRHFFLRYLCNNNLVFYITTMLSTMTAWLVSSDGSLSAPTLFISWSWATGWLNPFWAWAWLNQYSPPDSPPLSLMWLGAWHNSSNSSVWSVWKMVYRTKFKNLMKPSIFVRASRSNFGNVSFEI